MPNGRKLVAYHRHFDDGNVGDEVILYFVFVFFNCKSTIVLCTLEKSIARSKCLSFSLTGGGTSNQTTSTILLNKKKKKKKKKDFRYGITLV